MYHLIRSYTNTLLKLCACESLGGGGTVAPWGCSTEDEIFKAAVIFITAVDDTCEMRYVALDVHGKFSRQQSRWVFFRIKSHVDDRGQRDDVMLWSLCPGRQASLLRALAIALDVIWFPWR